MVGTKNLDDPVSFQVSGLGCQKKERKKRERIKEVWGDHEIYFKFSGKYPIKVVY